MIDYRKIIASRNLRMRILGLFSWVPDKWMLRIQYFLQTGSILHLKNPKTFQEKLQVYKISYHDPIMLQCTDKEKVREFVRKKDLSQILVPVIGVYEDVEKIDFDALPEKFVIKTSDGGGCNEVYICRNKNQENIEEIKKKLRGWISAPKSKKHIAREWAYDNEFPRKLIIENLLEEPGKNDIDDYKFYCFQGKFRFMQWHKDRHGDHRAGHCDENGKFLPEIHVDSYPTFDKAMPLPSNFKEMITIAEKLAENFPFVRVDLYSVNEQIYFSELTFYPASGFFNYKPEGTDEWLGTFFEYPFQTPRSKL